MEDKGFIDQSQWQAILDQQASVTAPDQNRPIPSPVTPSRRIGPWALSILLHVVLVAIALIWVWRDKPQQRIQPVIPTATLSAMAGGPAIAPDHQTVDALPEVDMQKIMTPTFDALPGLDTAPGADTASLLAPLPTPTAIAPKPQPIAPTPTPTRTNPFAGIMPQALEPAAAFFGVAGNAKRIVYVVDASGSLVDTLPYVLTELSRSISRLDKQQQFTVLFFQGNDLLELPPAGTGLRHATAVNINTAVKWITPEAGNLFAKGRSNPLPAIRKALGYQPEMLFLLTDNLAAQQTGVQDDAALLDQITQANTTHAAIHTIQFLYRDATDQQAENVPLLKQLADRNGGKYTFVDAKDLKTP